MVLALVLSMIVLPALPAFAGPQDDPPPPVAIVAGDGRLVPNFTYSLTLTLDGAAGNGDLEQGQVEQARAAAAAAQAAEAALVRGTGESSGERRQRFHVRCWQRGNAGTAVVGECSFPGRHGAGGGFPPGVATIRPRGRCW